MHPDHHPPAVPDHDEQARTGSAQPDPSEGAGGAESHGEPSPDMPGAGQPPELTDDMASEIDRAMQAMDAQAGRTAGDPSRAAGDQPAGSQNASGPARPAIRGPRQVRAGREHRTGTVISVGPTDIFIEFGPKELGVLERSQFKPEDSLPAVGEAFEVAITKYDPQESIYLCARPGAVQKADWELLEPGQTVEARVTGTNKGGLELEVAGHRAFMPASQVGLDRVPDLSVFVGEKLACEVQKVDRTGRGNIVLSRRNVLAKEREQLRETLRESLAEGQTLDGTVRKIMPFGAFVDLGGVDGLVHVSDLTHDRVAPGEKNVQRYIKEGQSVRVVILKLDWDSNRISLGMKQLEEDPFLTATNELAEGADVTGRVTKTAEFGAFVEVSPGVEGLVHISELDWKRVARVEDVVKPDEVVTVRVLKIDPESRKVSLSLKQTKPAPERPAGGAGKRGGKGERDTRTPDEILKEDRHIRRLREQAHQRHAREQQETDRDRPSKSKTAGKDRSLGGLGDFGGLGSGLGDLKL